MHSLNLTMYSNGTNSVTTYSRLSNEKQLYRPVCASFSFLLCIVHKYLIMRRMRFSNSNALLFILHKPRVVRSKVRMGFGWCTRRHALWHTQNSTAARRIMLQWLKKRQSYCMYSPLVLPLSPNFKVFLADCHCMNIKYTVEMETLYAVRRRVISLGIQLGGCDYMFLHLCFI